MTYMCTTRTARWRPLRVTVGSCQLGQHWGQDGGEGSLRGGVRRVRWPCVVHGGSGWRACARSVCAVCRTPVDVPQPRWGWGCQLGASVGAEVGRAPSAATRSSQCFAGVA